MNAIYGSTILSFPELMETILYFDQSPIVNGGYDKQTPSIPVRGMFQDEGSRAQDSNGNWVKTSSKTVWSLVELVAGKFVCRKEGAKEIIYRILTDQGWKFQMGFYVYGIEKVVGDSGRDVQAPVANLGGSEF